MNPTCPVLPTQFNCFGILRACLLKLNCHNIIIWSYKAICNVLCTPHHNVCLLHDSCPHCTMLIFDQNWNICFGILRACLLKLNYHNIIIWSYKAICNVLCTTHHNVCLLAMSCAQHTIMCVCSMIPAPTVPCRFLTKTENEPNMPCAAHTG